MTFFIASATTSQVDPAHHLLAIGETCSFMDRSQLHTHLLGCAPTMCAGDGAQLTVGAHAGRGSLVSLRRCLLVIEHSWCILCVVQAVDHTIVIDDGLGQAVRLKRAQNRLPFIGGCGSIVQYRNVRLDGHPSTVPVRSNENAIIYA